MRSPLQGPEQLGGAPQPLPWSGDGLVKPVLPARTLVEQSFWPFLSFQGSVKENMKMAPKTQVGTPGLGGLALAGGCSHWPGGAPGSVPVPRETSPAGDPPLAPDGGTSSSRGAGLKANP